MQWERRERVTVGDLKRRRREGNRNRIAFGARAGGTEMAEIAWTQDYAAALERARSENKFVLLDIFNPG